MQRLIDAEGFQLGADGLRKAGLDSGQNQAVSLEGLEICGIDGRQFCPAADGNGGDHAIGQTTRAASGLVEQSRGQHSISGQKRFGLREDLLRDARSGGIQRAALKFRPSDAAGVATFLRLRPSPEFLMRRRTSYDGLNQKVGIKVNHLRSTSGLADRSHPFRSFGCIQAENFLERLQSLQRRDDFVVCNR